MDYPVSSQVIKLWWRLTHSILFVPLGTWGHDQNPPLLPVFCFLPQLSSADSVHPYLLFLSPSPGFSRSSSCFSSWWWPTHGDCGDGRWFHPVDMADPARPSLPHLRTDVVCWGCRVYLGIRDGVRPEDVSDSASAAILECVEFAADDFGELS